MLLAFTKRTTVQNILFDRGAINVPRALAATEGTGFLHILLSKLFLFFRLHPLLYFCRNIVIFRLRRMFAINGFMMPPNWQSTALYFLVLVSVGEITKAAPVEFNLQK